MKPQKAQNEQKKKSKKYQPRKGTKDTEKSPFALILQGFTEKPL